MILLLALLIVAEAGHAPPAEIRGTLNDRLVAESADAQLELKPSDAGGLPGVARGEKVYRALLPQLRTPRTPSGLPIAFVSTEGGTLFIDADLDGVLGASERRSYVPASDYASAPEVQVELGAAGSGTPLLPFRCRIVEEEWEGETRYHVHFTATFRAEGYAEIGGRRTLVSLPFEPMGGRVEIRRGKIGIDANGDGHIDLRGISGPEVMFAKGEAVILRAGNTYVSVQSADYATRSLVLREHAAEDYTYVDVRIGAPLPDFSFTDFEGRARRLSDFRGKYVLLAFWGSWCAPCIADLPGLEAAYERFRGRGFEIVGIDYEHGATFDSVRALLEQKGVTWTNARPDSVRELVEKRLRIWGFPTFYLLDPEGIVIETRTEELRGEALIATLESRLEERKQEER
jgi:thiol-disulfide isomerase/thioredoxin